VNLINHFQTILVALTFFPIVYFLGSLFLVRAHSLSIEWKGVVGQAIGFGVLSYLMVLLGVLGYLRGNVLWGLYGTLLLLSLTQIRGWVGWIRSILARFSEETGWLGRSALFLGMIYFFILLVGSTAPEIGTDALCYHLGTPKAFLLGGGLFYSPYDINSIYPFFQQMLYLFGFGLENVILAKLIHFEMGILLFLSVFLILKRFQVQSAFFWALLFIVTPGITNQMTMAFTDVALTLYILLGMYFLFEGVGTQKKLFYILGGLFFGFAFSIKAVAGIYLAGTALACFVLLFSRREKVREYLSGFALGILLALCAFIAACGFWYLRTYFVMGNPLYPYFSGVEGGVDYAVGGRGISFVNFLLLPWNLVVHAASFGNRSDQIGPVFSLLLPFAIWTGIKIKQARYYMIMVFVSISLWFVVAERSRFLYPILPLYFVSGVMGIELFRKYYSKTSALLRLFFFVILLGGVALSGYHYRYQMKLFAGVWNDQDFRQNLERSTVITDYINQALPLEAKILNAEEIHRFYFNRSIVREGLFAEETRYYEQYNSAKEVMGFLKENGFTHVLIAEPVGAERNLEGLRIRVILDNKKYVDKYFEKIFESESLNKRDRKYHYALYRIR